jgi:hypothetical protein
MWKNRIGDSPDAGVIGNLCSISMRYGDIGLGIRQGVESRAAGAVFALGALHIPLLVSGRK